MVRYNAPYGAPYRYPLLTGGSLDTEPHREVRSSSSRGPGRAALARTTGTAATADLSARRFCRRSSCKLELLRLLGMFAAHVNFEAALVLEFPVTDRALDRAFLLALATGFRFLGHRKPE